MLSRFIANSSRHLRLLSLTPSPRFLPPSPSLPPSRIPKFGLTHFVPRHFSTHGNGSDDSKNGGESNSDSWKITPENDSFGAVFGGDLTELPEERDSKEFGGSDSGVEDWLAGTGEFKPWNLEEENKVEVLLGLEDVEGAGHAESSEIDGLDSHMEKNKEDDLELQKEEEELMAVLKGPNRAFGDLIAASGITDDMLDSLIALKDFKDIDGLPPLTEIEDKRYENTLKKSSRYEIELQKQEEIAKSRVRQVDEKGRAYGTGRRKCSIARVWIQPGEGQFLVNEKEFDVYFPMLDHRAALLRPLAETKTLGLWDVKCTVKGGGTSGQVGAIRLGISRALQNWEPGLRPPLREAGFLSRDPRVVERKKPGKAKARKSFQWVKR